ncbi:MAG: hypothetical protein U0793_14975 [Gemmataceae bacterium]
MSLLCPAGLLAALMGVGLAFPLLAAWLESDGLPTVGVALAAVSGVLILCGLSAFLVGVLRRGPATPSGVRIAFAANLVILAFCALELSDGLVRQGGRVIYWTTFLFPPALLLFYGLVSARRWAWWTARGLTALCVLWFVGFIAVIPFADLRGESGPTPWYGRIYMACVSLAFAAIFAGAYWSLGRAESRTYFGRAR